MVDFHDVTLSNLSKFFILSRSYGLFPCSSPSELESDPVSGVSNGKSVSLFVRFLSYAMSSRSSRGLPVSFLFLSCSFSLTFENYYLFVSNNICFIQINTYVCRTRMLRALLSALVFS